MDSEYLSINIEDIKKNLYFITSIVQKQTGHAMFGSLSSRGDLMGGILDRWINTVPESVFFNKKILPELSGDKNVEIITDFYLYNPKTAGVAPDVIGLRIDKRIVPFVKFRETWTELENMPQIEVKTFKKPQKMLSLRNQGYDKKFLILIESDFRIDYLTPIIRENALSDSVFEEMHMDDNNFIDSDVNHQLKQIEKISESNDNIGKIKLLRVTRASDFMNIATHCEGRVSIQYLNTIEEYSGKIHSAEDNTKISGIS